MPFLDAYIPSDALSPSAERGLVAAAGEQSRTPVRS